MYVLPSIWLAMRTTQRPTKRALSIDMFLTLKSSQEAIGRCVASVDRNISTLFIHWHRLLKLSTLATVQTQKDKWLNMD